MDVLLLACLLANRRELAHMPGFLERSFSGSRKRLLCRDETESNIFAFDIVGSDFVQSKFQEVQQSSKVVKLEIEDLIVGKCHQSLASEAEKLICTNDRDWESIHFVDTFEGEEYQNWKTVNDAMMRDYEVAFADTESSKWRDGIIWKANIEIHEHTSVADILNLFTRIKKDGDVVHLSLQGAHGVRKGIENLVGLIDWSRDR